MARNARRSPSSLAKARPGEIHYGTSGQGTIIHLSAELLMQKAGFRMTHVPYKGGGPALIDMVAGDIQVMFATYVTAVPHIRGGRLRALAVSTPQFHDVQLHLSEVRDGTAMMRVQASIEIPGGGSLHLAPGGYHLMMSDPRSPLRSGDTVSLRLEFSDGSVVSAEAPVKRLSAGAR